MNLPYPAWNYKQEEAERENKDNRKKEETIKTTGREKNVEVDLQHITSLLSIYLAVIFKPTLSC